MDEQQMIMLTNQKIVARFEGILFAAGDSVKTADLAQAVAIEEGMAQKILEQMAQEYQKVSHGIRLVQTEKSWQLSTKPELYPFIEKIVSINQHGGLSRAALETLSIIAYRQPVTRVDIENLRGVSSSSSIKNLLDRGLIVEAGRKDAPGRPFYYETTAAFLKSAHLKSLNELPDFENFYSKASQKDPESIEGEEGLPS
ncbi:MAG: SMC-Scp complex subunit ScpB [Eubacteriaceae bacterium]|nr:SMC-Scp complex subunit ScpB [Eubacteriaceae bacterium]MDD4508925.1 SMC-Scp complex subunit ScpB [Eubacteriaceae bacterium]